MTNRYTSFLLLLCISIFSVQAKQIKVLAIGNSFSEDAIEYYLSQLVEANGDTIIIGNMFIGGCSLENHYNNMINNSPNYAYRKIVKGNRSETHNYKLIDAISDEDWDYITFQQVSHLSGVYDSYFPYLESLIDFANEHSTNSDVKIALHATWAYEQSSTHSGFANYDNSQITMYDAIVDATNRVAQKTNINIIIPTVTAIQNGRSSILGDTFCKDGYHLEVNFGRFTASCAWYEMLFDSSVIDNRFRPDNISLLEDRIAKYSAHYAVKYPRRITPIKLGNLK